jgi:hypothetical protein
MPTFDLRGVPMMTARMAEASAVPNHPLGIALSAWLFILTVARLDAA